MDPVLRNLSPRALKLLDLVLLKAGWVACVVGAAQGQPWIGPAAVALALVLHLSLAPRPGRDLALLGVLALLGAITDGVLNATGVTSFSPEFPRLGLVPVWMFVLWPLFAMTFHSTMGWLKGRPVLAALLGLLGGPPGYVVADSMGALTLMRPLSGAVVALGVAWAVALPMGFWFATRQDLELRRGLLRPAPRPLNAGAPAPLAVAAGRSRTPGPEDAYCGPV